MKWAQSFLAALLLISPMVAHAQSPVKREYLEMTELSERRIRQTVQDYLGPDSRAVVSVYLKEKVKAQGGPQNAETPDSKSQQPASDDANWILSGPYTPPGLETTSSPESSQSFEIESAEVSIQVEKIVDAKARGEIEKIVKTVLRGVTTKVTVSASLATPVAQADRERKASEEASRGPASVTESVLESLVRRFGPLVPLAAALVLLLGVLVIALVLRSSAKELSDGLKSMRPAVSNSGSQTISLNAPLSASSQIEHKNPSSAALPGSGPHRGSLPPPPVMGGELRKGLQSVEAYLMESPLLFVRSVTDDPADLMGLKFLVSKFSNEARAKLKELMGVERLLKASSFEAGDSVVGFNAAGWLQQLIEKIELKKLAGGTVIEEALSNDESLLLSNASQDKLLEAALKVNTPAAWRVVTDFLPMEFLKKRVRDFDRQMWTNVIKGSLVADVGEVNQAAKAVIDIVRMSVSENVVLFKAQRERDEHFSKRLLPPLIDTILGQELGEDDEFIGFIVAETPEFARVIRETVWTPSRLADLSDDSLKAVFLGIDNENKSYLVFAFPETVSKRLESFLPEGNAKKIVLDAVNRLRSTGDQALKDRARSLAREFMDHLRVGVLRGSIQLKEGALDAPAPINAKPVETEAEVVAVETEEAPRKAS